MSLVALALTTCLRQALLGRTHAEDRVYDGLITPIDQLALDGPRPLIVVSSDDDEGDLRSGNRRMMISDRHLQIVIEMTLASAVTVTAAGVEVEIPHTDEGMERTLTSMERRVFAALADPASAWAERYRAFMGQTRRYARRRGAGTAEGVLYAARQIVLVLDPIEEPAYGVEPDPEGPWADLIAAMRAEPGLQPYADLLHEDIVGAPLGPWQATQARLGATRPALDALGLGALPGGEDEPPFVAATLVSGLGTRIVTAEPTP